MSCTYTRICLCLHIRRAYTHVLVWCSVRCMCTHKLTCDTHSAYIQARSTRALFTSCVHICTYAHAKLRTCVHFHACVCSLTEHTYAHPHARAYQLWSNSTRKQTKLPSTTRNRAHPRLFSRRGTSMHPNIDSICRCPSTAKTYMARTWRFIFFLFKEGGGNSGELVHHWLFGEASGLTQDVAMVWCVWSE